MPVKIVLGENQMNKQKARGTWELVKNPAVWGTQPTPEKWEAVRRFMVYFLKREFPDLIP